MFCCCRSGRGRGYRDGKVERLQGQVDEVVDIMQDNIGRVMERGDRLDDLADKSGQFISCSSLSGLQAVSSLF